jgi:hypothetical protein
MPLSCQAAIAAAGGVAFHLLRTETPKIAATTEQQIRGGKDTVADWIVVAIGYDRAAASRAGRPAQSGRHRGGRCAPGCRVRPVPAFIFGSGR